MISAGTPAIGAAARSRKGGRRLPLSWLGVLPFFGYVGFFLLLPTGIVAAGSLVASDGSLASSNFTAVDQPFILKSITNSLVISTVSAVVGAFAGAILAYAVVTGNPDGVLRRTVTSAAGVLAQFGGVTLAFAFIATLGTQGFVTLFLGQHGIDIFPKRVWLYDLSGLTLIYLYFQIPLMVLVFLPALDGVRPQWREAVESMGGNTWHYWRYVAAPLLAPSFVGCTLLLFANSFSAYATAAALISQGGVIVPLEIQQLLIGETGRTQPGFAKALALTMIVIVAIVMILYSVFQRQTSRWLR